MEEIEEVIEGLEEKVLDSQDAGIKGEIHRLKKELLVLRKSISPLREAIGRFSKTDSPCVEESCLVFIRDLYDHTIQIMDMVETYRDMLNQYVEGRGWFLDYEGNEILESDPRTFEENAHFELIAELGLGLLLKEKH